MFSPVKGANPVWPLLCFLAQMRLTWWSWLIQVNSINSITGFLKNGGQGKELEVTFGALFPQKETLHVWTTKILMSVKYNMSSTCWKIGKGHCNLRVTSWYPAWCTMHLKKYFVKDYFMVHEEYSYEATSLNWLVKNCYNLFYGLLTLFNSI